MGWKGVKEKFLNGGGIFMYLRSVVTSQISGWTDFGMSFLSFAALGLSSSVSAAVGAISGGIVNCIINYRFTFKCADDSYINVAVKYAMVWVGSFLLNTFGTGWATSALQGSAWLDSMGVSENLRFTVGRLAVALAVSVLWNYMLQRFFVFRPNPFDRVLNRLLGRKKEREYRNRL